MPTIDVSEELYSHYEVIKAVRDQVVADDDEKGSSKAAMLNTLTAILRDLAKVQTELYNSSTLAELQAAIVEALTDYDPEFKQKVVEILERRLIQKKETE